MSCCFFFLLLFSIPYESSYLTNYISVFHLKIICEICQYTRQSEAYEVMPPEQHYFIDIGKLFFFPLSESNWFPEPEEQLLPTLLKNH